MMSKHEFNTSNQPMRMRVRGSYDGDTMRVKTVVMMGGKRQYIMNKVGYGPKPRLRLRLSPPQFVRMVKGFS